MSNFYVKHLQNLGYKEKEMPKFVQHEIAANRRHSMIVAQYNSEISGINQFKTRSWYKTKGSVSHKTMLNRIKIMV